MAYVGRESFSLTFSGFLAKIKVLEHPILQKEIPVMATPATATLEDVWFKDNDTYCAMRFWVSDFTGTPAGHLSMHDVRLSIISNYPGGIDAFIDNYVDTHH